MAKVYNRARMTTATATSGTITLGSAVSKYQTFAAAGVANGDVVRYTIEDGTAWEIGTGTYTTAGTTLSRTLASSSTGSLLVLSGTAEVFITAAAADIANLGEANTFTAANAFGNGTGAPTVSINGAAANNRSLVWQTNGSWRWQACIDNTAEAGSNAGSDWRLAAYDDAGAIIITPLKITRSTGAVYIPFIDPSSKFGSNTTTNAFVVVNAVSGGQKAFNFQTAGVNRWLLASNNTAESGSDAGANFDLYSYTDAGVFKETPVTVNRATGTTTLKALTLTNPLAVAQGGTNSTATATAGGAGYGTGTAHAYTAAGTSGQFLQSAGASAPAWASATGRLLRAPQILTTGTTYTTPANCTAVYVECVGGGGGGGGTPATANTAGPGGGGGGYAAKYFVVTASTAYTIAIGAAGTGTSGAAGGNGGSTTFTVSAVTVTAAGGTGGVLGTVGPLAGGAGGAGTTGDLNLTGEAGSYCNSSGAGTGGSARVLGGAPGAPMINVAGPAGSFGSGGAGASTTAATARAGGAGGAGFIRVWEFV
jgi:hypothetical protein